MVPTFVVALVVASVRQSVVVVVVSVGVVVVS